jgi:hypothetical protein
MAQRTNTSQNTETEGEIVIKQDTEDGLLQVLLKEYELTLNRLEGLDNRIFQFLGAALLVLGFLTGYVLVQNRQSNFPIAGAWFIPLFCITMYAILLFLVYLIFAGLSNARILSERINTLLREKAVIRFEEYAPESLFFSSRRGNPKPRLLYIILSGGSAFLFLPIIYISFTTIYDQNHLAGSCFVIIYASLTMLVLYAASGLTGDLPRHYSTFIKEFEKKESNSQHSKFTSAISSVRVAFATIIPRPWDVIAKGPFFVYGYVIGLVVLGVQNWQLPLINLLFSTTHEWKSVSEIPTWAILALGAVFFIVEEILLQQAKLTWNDIRDVEDDKKILRNDRRAIVSGALSISTAIRNMLFRWILALILGYVLGGFSLLVVFLLISLHQAIYVLFAKPRSAKHPVALLFFLSLTVPFRFLAGVIAVVGPQWSMGPFVLFFVLFYFCSFGALAAYLKMEAEHYYDINPNQLPRPHSEFYRQRGRFWQYVGLVAAVLFGTFMVIIQFLTTRCDSQLLPLQFLYARCAASSSQAISFVPLGLSSIFWILGLITLFTLLSISFILVFNKPGNFIVRKIEKIKGVIMIVLFFLAIMLLLQATLNTFPFFMWNSVYILYWGFLFLNAGYLLMYEGMTYLDYTNTNLRNRLPCIKKAWFEFLFVPTKQVELKHLIGVMFSDCDTTTYKTLESTKPSDK